MKLTRKILSFIMAFALVLTTVPVAFPVGEAKTEVPKPADASLVLHRPMANVVVSDVTRVAYAENSMKPPSGMNSVIVKATPSGIPYLTGSHAELAYAGETPEVTMISFTPGVSLKKPPKISCNNTTVTLSDFAYTSGTYTWYVMGGTAAEGTTLLFKVDYSYGDFNEVTGKTYTNNFSTYGTSYVEAINPPAGVYTSKRTYEDYGLGTGTRNRSYIATYLLGINSYGGFYNGAKGYGSVDFESSENWSETGGWTEKYGMMKHFDGSNASTNENAAYMVNDDRPYTTVYFDKSIHSTLSDLNLRTQTVVVRHSDEADERVSVSFENKFVSYGTVQTFAGATEGKDPPTDDKAVRELNITNYTGSVKTPGSAFSLYFTGVGPDKADTSTEYTVSYRYKTPAQWTNVFVGHSFTVNIVTYDKGQLRTLVEEIQGTDPTIMSVNIPDGGFKGCNPQAWYFADGWEYFFNTYNSAKSCLNRPDVTQTQINAQYNELIAAYKGLKLKTADYSVSDAYYNQALNKSRSNYTLASWAKLQTLLDNYQKDCSVLYQPAVDKMGEDIRIAMNSLEECTADYSDFLANLSTVNNMMKEAPAKYGRSIDKVYTNWKELVSVLNKSGCVYNELDGYSVQEYLTSGQQPTVDGYTQLLVKAINGLTFAKADYTLAEKLENEYRVIDKSRLVPECEAPLTEAYNRLYALHGLNITRQKDIDAAAKNLQGIIAELRYKPADTKAALNEIAAAEGLDRSVYGDLSAVDRAVANLRSKLGLDIRYQSDIDNATVALHSAIESLTKNSADYGEVDKAIAAAESKANYIKNTYSKYGFTAETFYSNWSAVTASVNNVVRNLPVTQQPAVDGYASAINSALANLTENKADYFKVNTAKEEAYQIILNDTELYTQESLDNLTAAYAGVIPNLNISSQAEVDAFEVNIRKAMAELQYLSADYTEADKQIKLANEKIAEHEAYGKAHPGYDYYTEESLSKLNVAIAAVVDNLDIRQQNTVNLYVSNIAAAISGLKNSAADYIAVDVALASVPKDTSLYTTVSVATLNATIKSIKEDYTSDKQASVDRYATSVNNAVKNLKYKKADYSAVTNALSKVPADSSAYTPDSWQYLQSKIDAVVYDLDITHQEEVNTYAEAILAAVEILKLNKADYTVINNAVDAANVKIATGNYTDKSVGDLRNLIANIDWELDTSRQSEVNAYAKRITDAADALVLKNADYKALNEEIAKANRKIATGNYTEASVGNLQAAINGIKMDCTILEQETVNAAVVTLREAVGKLQLKKADYTALDEVIEAANTKIATGYYTDATTAPVLAKINEVDKTLDITQQEIVDKYREDISKLTNEMVLKLANYTELREILDLLDNPSSEIYTNTYTNLNEVLSLIASYRTETVESNMNLTIDRQEEVNTMASTLRGYLDMLEEYVGILAADGSTTVIKGSYIYGLKTRLTRGTFENSYIRKSNVTLSYKNQSGRFVTTGTVVTVTSDITGEVVAEYTIVVYGDVNGDAVINSADVIMLQLVLEGKDDEFSKAVAKAANINGDRVINALDASKLAAVAAGSANIDQSTGRLA